MESFVIRPGWCTGEGYNEAREGPPIEKIRLGRARSYGNRQGRSGSEGDESQAQDIRCRLFWWIDETTTCHCQVQVAPRDSASCLETLALADERSDEGDKLFVDDEADK